MCCISKHKEDFKIYGSAQARLFLSVRGQPLRRESSLIEPEGSKVCLEQAALADFDVDAVERRVAHRPNRGI